MSAYQLRGEAANVESRATSHDIRELAGIVRRLCDEVSTIERKATEAYEEARRAKRQSH